MENKILIKLPKGDLISDAVARIRNGYMGKLPQIVLGYKTLIGSALEVLKAQGFVKDFSVGEDVNKKPCYIVDLLYTGRKQPSLHSIQIISTPSKPVYIKCKEIKDFYKQKCYFGYGVALISTSRGVMAGHDAVLKRLGGKVLFVCN